MGNIHSSRSTEFLATESTAQASLDQLTALLGSSISIEETDERIQQQLAMINREQNLEPGERHYDES